MLIWSVGGLRFKYWYVLLASFASFIFFGHANATDSICKIETLADEVADYLKHNPGKSSWFALDHVIAFSHISLGQECFEQWSRPLNKRAREPIIREFHTFKAWTASPFYGPASNFGYAMVYLNDIAQKATFSDRPFEINSVIVKESFHVDPKGFVYPNPVVFMRKITLEHWEYYSFTHRVNKTEEKELFCLRCHKTKKNNDYLFLDFHKR